MEFSALSVGYALDVASAGVGVVHSVFARAVNCEMRGNLWTLMAADRADLPFGIRVPLEGFNVPGVRAGDPVNVRSGFVGIGSASSRLLVDCRAAPRWVPTCRHRLSPGLPRRLGIVSRAACGRSWHGSAAMAHAVLSAVHDPEALGRALTHVVGGGPGLTPAGDDVLVGVLSVLTSPPAGVRGAEAAESLGRLILPLLPRTTSVSGHLLRQAANGLFSRPVHELVSALIADASPSSLSDLAPPSDQRERSIEETPAAGPSSLSDLVHRVIETGATSGADTCEGVLEFAPSFFISRDERAAA